MDKINKPGFKIWIPSLSLKTQNFFLFTVIFTFIISIISSIEYYSEYSINYLFELTLKLARSGIVICLYTIILYLLSPNTKISRKIYRIFFMIISLIIYISIILLIEIKLKFEGGIL